MKNPNKIDQLVKAFLVTLLPGAALPGSLLSGCLGVELPDSAQCAAGITEVSSTVELDMAIKDADKDSCVVLHGGDYQGNWTLENGVRLVAERDAEVQLTGTKEQDFVLRLESARSEAIGLNIRGEKLGVFLAAPDVSLRDVVISHFDIGGIVIHCEDAGCARGTGQFTLDNVTASSNGFGLFADSGDIVLSNSSIAKSSTDQLVGGAGIYVTGSAFLLVQESTISKNDLGVIVDGAEAKARFERVEVSDNQSLGIWGQRLRGTSSVPALTIGEQTEIIGNGVVGVGIVDSTGVLLDTVNIADTVLRQVVASDGSSASVADGIGVFADSSEVAIKNANLYNNGRTQALVDSGGESITFADSNHIAAEQSQHRIVIQNTQATVVVPQDDLSQAAELKVSTPIVALPDI